MKNIFLKIFLLFFTALLVTINAAYAQSCNTLKEIFENSDYCDNNEISVHGRVYELLDNKLALQGSKYVYGFQLIDDDTQIIRVVSQDDMF